MKIYQVNDGNNFNGISVTQVAIKPVRSQKSKVVSFADITFNNVFVVKDLKVVNGSKGPFVSFPQKSYDKNGKKEYYDTAHPITGDLRKYIQGIVLTYNNQTTPQQQQNFSQPQNQQQQNHINNYNRQQQQNFNQQPQQGFNQQQQQNFNQQPQQQQQKFGQQPQQQNFNQQQQPQQQQNPFMNNVPNNKINSVLMGGN